MKVEWADFNDAEDFIHRSAAEAWGVLLQRLIEMPLHIKESDQAGIQGTFIFDPVGTNQFIKDALVGHKWKPNVAIPSEYSFLGTDVDFIKDTLLVEVQFSNYPFLLNNLLRSELFYKGNILLSDECCRGLVIITKAHMFPASNSTLYYEQALKQLNALSRHKVLSIPIRLIRLYEDPDAVVTATFTEYSSKRYSREPKARRELRIVMERGARPDSRYNISAKAPPVRATPSCL